MTTGTLGTLLERRAVDRSGHPFVRTRNASLSFAEFNRQCNRLAHGFAALGVGKGDIVMVMLPNRIEYVLIWFALAKLGAVEAPINTAFRGPGLTHMLNLTESAILITDDNGLGAIGDIADDLTRLRTIITLEDATPVSGFPRFEGMPFHDLPVDRDDNPTNGVAPSDLLMLLFTSGTTGRSKACMLSHRYAIRQAELMSHHFGIGSDDVLYCAFPMFYIDQTICTIMPALVCGCTAAIGERFTLSGFWDEIRYFGATTFDFIGATITLLWKQAPSPDDRNHRMRLAWGIPMPSFREGFEERFGFPLRDGYGLTEAGVFVYSPREGRAPPGSCGQAIDQFDVRIFDDNDRELPRDQVGEIVMRPREPGLIMDGYFRMPAETLAMFRNLWLHTGDLGRMDAHGNLYFVGRKKDAIRRRGQNISASEIEEVIAGHPEVLECAAFGVPSELSEEDVMVCVVKRPAAMLSPDGLIAFCEDRMAHFMIPRYVEFVRALPKTPTEKVEKRRLQETGVTATTWDREG